MTPLAVLIGRWEIVGRSLHAPDDNIHGHVTVEPIPGGQVLQRRGTMRVNATEVDSLELIWADPSGNGRHESRSWERIVGW